MSCTPITGYRCECSHVDVMDSLTSTGSCRVCGSSNWKEVQVGHVCTRGKDTERCTVCGAACRPWTLCDWKLKGSARGKTCDRVMCLGCAREVAPEKHLCPAHAKLWDQHEKNPKRAQAAG